MRRNRPERGFGSRLPALAATLLSPVLLYLIAKSAAAGLSPATALFASTLPPRDPAPLLKQLGRIAQNPQMKVDSRSLALARQGLVDSPLAYEPFFIAGRAAEQAGDAARATALMEEARHRRPTQAATRMQLMVYYSKARRYDEALAEMDVVLRRNEEVRRLLLPELAKLIGDPMAREAIAKVLAREPEWREDFFNIAATQKLNPADARSLYELVRARKPRGGAALERQLVLQTQASSGDYAGARATWLAGLPAAARPGNALLFDGSFRGLRAAKPFAWEYHDVDVGRAEPARDGGRAYLDVAYFGGRRTILAEQVLALTPGRYTLKVTARSETGIPSGRLVWRLTCLPAGTDLALLDLAPLGGADRRFALAFTVPPGCAGQQLALLAEPGDVASVVNAQLSAMGISR